jgi:purine-binding chemotaxis protein CheW
MPGRWKAEELRREFDGSFALARTASPEHEDILAIQFGGDPHALRLADIAGLFVDRPITPLPSRRPEVLGLAGFRGAILPVFDLAAVLGYTASRAPRWLVVAAAAPIAFAFEALIGHHRVDRRAVSGEVVDVDGRTWPLVALASVVTTVGGASADRPGER